MINNKLKLAIEEQLEILENDSRHKAKPASIEINAPLALIQVDIDSEIRTLKKVLAKLAELSEIKRPDFIKDEYLKFLDDNLGGGAFLKKRFPELSLNNCLSVMVYWAKTTTQEKENG